MLVIALFYTSRVSPPGLVIASVFMLGLLLANLVNSRRAVVYLVLGVGVWYGLLTSGIHATLAGVLVAMTVPARVKVVPGALAAVLRRGADRLDQTPAGPRGAEMNTSRVAVIERLDHALSAAKTPLQRFEHAVTPWVTFAIMPVFALFNAGVRVDVMAAANLGMPVPLGIILGLVIGKQVGVFAAAWLPVKTNSASNRASRLAASSLQRPTGHCFTSRPPPG